MSEVAERRSVNGNYYSVTFAVESFFQLRRRPGGDAGECAMPLHCVLGQSGVAGTRIMRYDVTIGSRKERNSNSTRWPLAWEPFGDNDDRFVGELCVRNDADSGGCQLTVRGATEQTSLLAHVTARQLLRAIAVTIEQCVNVDSRLTPLEPRRSR